jgi:small subunit ribosomal protein S4e
MPKNHLKRIASPKTWPVKRKESTWITRPQGAHSFESGMPVNVVLKELIKLAKTTKEVKNILNHKTVMINGKQTKVEDRTFGLFDILSVKETKENYTLILNKQKKLAVRTIEAKEASKKISKIIGKTYLKNKKIQINLHDGINVLVDKDDYKVGDSIVIEIPGFKVLDKLALDKKACVFITTGKHAGNLAVVEKIEDEKIISKYDDHELELKKSQVIVVGKEKPIVSYLTE